MPDIPERSLFANSAFSLSSHRVEQKGVSAQLTAENGGYQLRIEREGAQPLEKFIAPCPAGMPAYKGNIPVLAAMYQLAAHEVLEVLTPEGLLRAGANWGTVWTRDIAYATMLGINLAQPDACRKSLESRVHEGHIRQDTGTGGSWPISTDRVVWVLGAWTYYQSTQDKEWLEWCLPIIQNTFEQDARILQKKEGITPGESSFLDWREQSYPDWMSTADIGASFAFGTNVLHSCAYRIYSRMLKALGRKEEAKEWRQQSLEMMERCHEKFWHKGARQYGMMRTPDGYLDERSDALATALAVLSGIAGEHAQAALKHLPTTPYGTPVFAPWKSTQAGSYHNRGIWPFTEAFVLLAHAEQQDIESAERSMACILRTAMISASHKENWDALTGEPNDTLLNSDAQLWSSAGMLGFIYYGFFGLHIERGNLVFNPCVPKAYAGSHWLMGLRIGNMKIDVHLNGYGSEVCSVLINGKMASPIIPIDREGQLLIELELQPSEDEAETCYLHPEARADLAEPQWDAPSPEHLSWLPVEGASAYRVLYQGKAVAQTATCSFEHAAPAHYAQYRIQAVNEYTQSCPGRPYEIVPEGARSHLAPERIGAELEHAVQNGRAWLDTQASTSRLAYQHVELAEGRYQLRFNYSNATASLRDGDTCALRALYVDGEPRGYIALPHHTEEGQWEAESQTAPFELELTEGWHQIELRYTPDCGNSNGSVNQCMLMQCECTKVD